MGGFFSSNKQNMIENFRLYNIYWYDSNSNRADWEEVFSNVIFNMTSNIKKIINFFNNYNQKKPWIVIISLSKGEKLISELHNKKNIKAFCLYNMSPQSLGDWTQKYEKIKGIVEKPEDLYKILLKINSEYIPDLNLESGKVPNFNYFTTKKYIIRNFDLNPDKINNNKYNQYVRNHLNIEINLLNQIYNKNEKNINNFYLSTLSFYEKNLQNLDNNLKKEIELILPVIYNQKDIKSDTVIEFLNFLYNITLISFYFSNYKYKYSKVSYEEINDIFKMEYKLAKNKIAYKNLRYYTEILSIRLKNNESLLERNDDLLNEFQKSAIYFNLLSNSILVNPMDIQMIYISKSLYKDIDFTLKSILIKIQTGRPGYIQNIMKNLYQVLFLYDARIMIYSSYISMHEEYNILSQKDTKILDNSLIIKDFLVLGSFIFHSKIKSIEKSIDKDSIGYLSIEKVENYYKELICKMKYKKISFFVIISDEFYDKYDIELNLLFNHLGIIPYYIILVENEEKTLISLYSIKRNGVSIPILTYCLNDIINYLKNDGLSSGGITEDNWDLEIAQKLNYKYSPMDLDNNIKELDNGWELSDYFNTDLLNNILLDNHKELGRNMGNININLYKAYKDKNAEDLFLTQYCKYFGFSLRSESDLSPLVFGKSILYAYSKQEVGRKSFYDIMNTDLKSGNPKKICRYLELISFLNQLIKNKEICSFSGTVYRGTFLNTNLIKELKPGKRIVNTTFMSTSKVYKVAKQFLMNQDYKNAFLIIDAKNKNVDIEDLSFYGNEKEVLFMPFSQFEIMELKKTNTFDKLVYEIKLKELDLENQCNYDNMKNLNTIEGEGYDILFDKVMKDNLDTIKRKGNFK